jgi:hypothetical protein
VNLNASSEQIGVCRTLRVQFQHQLSSPGPLCDIDRLSCAFSPFYANAQGWNPPQWIEVHELDKTAQKRSTKFIESNTVDWGEAEAIALAIQVEADWFVTDDAKARQLAESLGLESH